MRGPELNCTCQVVSDPQLLLSVEAKRPQTLAPSSNGESVTHPDSILEAEFPQWRDAEPPASVRRRCCYPHSPEWLAHLIHVQITLCGPVELRDPGTAWRGQSGAGGMMVVIRAAQTSSRPATPPVDPHLLSDVSTISAPSLRPTPAPAPLRPVQLLSQASGISSPRSIGGFCARPWESLQLHDDIGVPHATQDGFAQQRWRAFASWEFASGEIVFAITHSQ
jgi:hypothetical protein